MIELPAVPSPHEGVSYNPTVTSHQGLLRIAHTIEEQHEKEAEELAAVKEKMSGAVGNAEESKEGVARGMKLDIPQGDEEMAVIVDSQELPLPKKPTKRKTTQERRKQAKIRAQVGHIIHSYLSHVTDQLSLWHGMNRNVLWRRWLTTNDSLLPSTHLSHYGRELQKTLWNAHAYSNNGNSGNMTNSGKDLRVKSSANMLFRRIGLTFSLEKTLAKVCEVSRYAVFCLVLCK